MGQSEKEREFQSLMAEGKNEEASKIAQELAAEQEKKMKEEDQMAEKEDTETGDETTSARKRRST